MTCEITGSKVHRVVQCPASAVLPWDRDERAERATEPARNRGTEVHAFLEQVKLLGRDEALARVADEDVRALCGGLDLDNLPSHLATEVAMAWNWRTRRARYLGQNLGHRNYAGLELAPEPDEIPLTVDVMGSATQEARDGALCLGYVGDYKTGHTRYPRPGQYGQTLLGGLCARELLGAEQMVLELIYLDAHGQAFPVRDRVDGWALDAFADDLASAMDALPDLRAAVARGETIAATAGDHCQYCGAYKHCSATTGLLRHLGREAGNVGIELVPADAEDGVARRLAITVENAGRIYLQIERIEDALAAAKKEICDLAWHAPVALPDGRVIGPLEETTRSVDPQVAFAVLEERYGRAAAMSATRLKISLEAIRAAVSERLDPEAIPRQTVEGKHGIFPQVMDQIARRAGLIVKTRTVVRPHHPKRQKRSPGS